MLKNDKWIAKKAANGMIAPFLPELIREIEVTEEKSYTRKIISCGLSSYGYDIRLSPIEFKIFRHIPGTTVNPKKFNPENLESVPLHHSEEGDYFIIPAHSYGLGVAMERLEIPANIICLFIGKSTYARCGLIWNLTPGEPLWRGHLTLEVSNSSSADCMLFANEGVVQALFFEGEPCATTYDSRTNGGKYQDQPQKIIMAKV